MVEAIKLRSFYGKSCSFSALPEISVDHRPVPGSPYSEEAIEAGPEHPEDDGAQKGEHVTRVPVTLPLPTILSFDVPDNVCDYAAFKKIYCS